MNLKYIAAAILQWSWGLPQNISGLLSLVFLGKQPREKFRTAIVTTYSGKRIRRADCFSLGMFIFIESGVSETARKKLISHEYGHTVQSLLLGPLFLPLVGLPSSLWNLIFTKRRKVYKARGIRYCSRYPEAWANKLGERVTGLMPIDW